MSNHFRIEGPALVSLSGGRTSAYMLRRLLDEGLDGTTHVVFADTGKEFPETYAFLDEIARRWAVRIERVAYDRGAHATPFDALIASKRYLPNPVQRLCTQFLKMEPLQGFMLDRGYAGWWNVVGLRADEPSRVATRRAETNELWDNVLPLADAGVTKRDVMSFWARQPFDLQLQPWESNCDLCFLKGDDIRIRIMRDHPHLAEWWIEKERQVGATFRPRGPNYAALLAESRLPILPNIEGDLSLDCYCTD